MIDVKINKDIKEYSEVVFWGMNLRQCICLVTAIVLAFGMYFLFSGRLAPDLISMIIVFVTVPLVFLGFFTFNGMTAEKLVWQIIKTKYIYPSRYTYRSKPIYADWTEQAQKKQEREKLIFTKGKK